MRVAVKPVITTSVALVGASVIAVAPVEPPAPNIRVVESDVALTASSLAYVPINMIEQALSAPANMVAALDRLATALAISGSWNDSHPNNVWGWDPANPAMFREMINTMVPFPAFSEPWGRHLNWWATANLPMYEGCAYECPDLPGMLDRMFTVPMSEFYDEDGYTFPVVINPIDGVETEWSGQTVKLDPAEPMLSVWDSWTSEPTGIKTTTWWEAVTAIANFGAALQITGHLPDWVAVREIEAFVKHFLRPPAEEEIETPSGASELALVSDSAVAGDTTAFSLSPVPAAYEAVAGVAETADDADEADAPVDEESEASEESDGAEVEPATDTESDVEPGATSIVESATNFLKGKFALADAEDSDEADEADTAAESKGKHRKGDDSETAKDAKDPGAESDTSETAGSGGDAGSGGSGGSGGDSGDS